MTCKQKYHGLNSILEKCQTIYKNPNNAQQIKSVKKFRQGGPDPLDYINVYLNETDPKHFHYVTCGLSDIYDEFPLSSSQSSPLTGGIKPSGFGFELTFRIRSPESIPPKWPAILLQSLARYVYRSQTVLLPGDHIPWNRPLNQFNSETNNNCQLRHMILCKDTQLDRISTHNGFVDFIQVYGVTDKELEIVQSQNVNFLFNMILSSGRISDYGGTLFVTDINRKCSVNKRNMRFERNTNPSSLSGVTVTGLEWNALNNLNQLMELLPGEEFSTHLRQIKSFQFNLESKDKIDIDTSEIKYDDDENSIFPSSIYNNSTPTPNSSQNNTPCTPLEKLSILSGEDEIPSPLSDHSIFKLNGKFIEIIMPISAGKLLPIAISNRVLLSYHFTFLHAQNPDKAVTFVPSNTRGAFVNEDSPFACRGNWLQVYISEEFAEELDFQFSCSKLNCIEDNFQLPLVFRWPERHLRICLTSNTELDKKIITSLSEDSPTFSMHHKSNIAFRPIPTPEMLQKLLSINNNEKNFELNK